jgi:HEAT repeat protein
MRTNGVKRPGLLGAIILGSALAAILIAVFCITYRSPAPLPTRLAKLVHDLRAEVPVYYSFIYRLSPKVRAVWVPGWLLTRARQEAERISWQRVQAMYGLGQMGTNVWPAIPTLLAALENRDLQIRYGAAVVLGRIHADQAADFERLKHRLRNRERPADVLAMLLTERDEYARPYRQEIKGFALAGLAALGPGARSQLGTMLEIAKTKENDHELRAKTLGTVYSVGSAGKNESAVLKQLFQDPEEWSDVRGAAVHALAGVASDDPQLQPLLRQALGDSHALVRIAAAQTLWELGAPATEVLPVLTEALGHKLASVRVAALKALAGMGKAARPTESAVRGLLSDEKEPVRLAAKAALASMGLKGVAR